MPLSNHDCSISPVIQVFIRFICGGSPSDSYESEVKLRLFGSIYKRFSCVFQAFTRFICSENMVRKWRNCGADMVVGWCICGVYMLGFLNFCCQCGEFVIWKRWFELCGAAYMVEFAAVSL